MTEEKWSCWRELISTGEGSEVLSVVGPLQPRGVQEGELELGHLGNEGGWTVHYLFGRKGKAGFPLSESER